MLMWKEKNINSIHMLKLMWISWGLMLRMSDAENIINYLTYWAFANIMCYTCGFMDCMFWILFECKEVF